MNSLKDLIKNSFHNFNQKFTLSKNDILYSMEIVYDLNVEYSDPEIVVIMETKKHKIEFSFHLNSFLMIIITGIILKKSINILKIPF